MSRPTEALTRDLLGARSERGLFGRCIYCGEPCQGLACRAHRDLLELDPNTYILRLPAAARGHKPERENP